MSQTIFTSLYERGEPFALIDTRERREQVNGHWFGSTHVPLSALTSTIIRLVPDRHFPIHLLDWQNHASDAAAQQLSQLGYQKVTRHRTSTPDNFGQGFVQGEYVWSKAFGEVVAHTCALPEITPADYLAHHRDARLFDVRPTAEYAQFTIPASQSLPNSLLLANMEALEQTGAMALLHCAGRTRSIIGACTLKAAGYRGPYAIFKGGTQAWQLDGFEREFNATRLFAKETDQVKPVKDFLTKWHIHHQPLESADLADFVNTNADALLFDVSDDAATGQPAQHNIVKISGTNLVQQTDRSIARYHVPVILFDHGSGSRAAFAAYWLTAMGFTVSVADLSDRLANIETESRAVHNPPQYRALTTTQLLQHRDAGGRVLDFRSSQEFTSAHLAGSQWANISELLTGEKATPEPVAVTGHSIAQASDTADLLDSYGWQIAGLYHWQAEALKQGDVQTGNLATPIDECALFAGRHHGNMQDSRDYLAWEEALPEQIDAHIRNQWHHLLDRNQA